MTRTSYNDVAAAAFQASRELPPDALGQWREGCAPDPPGGR